MNRLMELLRKMGLLSRESVYYIGGSDVLPPPLKGQEESDALTALEAGQDSAKQRLIEHNLRLVVFIARRFENTGTNLEDLISIGTIGLIKGISSFDPAKGARLATYAARCIENAILSQMRLWFRINPPRAKKNTNGVFWHRFPRIFTSFAPLRTAM